jgi:hypothetical protein
MKEVLSGLHGLFTTTSKRTSKLKMKEVLSGLHDFRAFEMYLRQPQSEPQSLQ